MAKEEIKVILKKIWNFLWNDDSIWSWIVSLILAFLLVKFILFPALSLIFASSMPLVVVESSSMHHPGNFFSRTLQTQSNFDLWWNGKSNWYESKNITKLEAENWPLRAGLEIGDIVVLSGWSKPKVGDIIIFSSTTVHPIIHRVIAIKEINGNTYYSTKGDNNEDQLIQEKSIPKDALIGKAIMRIPLLGWIKLGVVKLFQ